MRNSISLICAILTLCYPIVETQIVLDDGGDLWEQEIEYNGTTPPEGSDAYSPSVTLKDSSFNFYDSSIGMSEGVLLSIEDSIVYLYQNSNLHIHSGSQMISTGELAICDQSTLQLENSQYELYGNLLVKDQADFLVSTGSYMKVYQKSTCASEGQDQSCLESQCQAYCEPQCEELSYSKNTGYVNFTGDSRSIIDPEASVEVLLSPVHVEGNHSFYNGGTFSMLEGSIHATDQSSFAIAKNSGFQVAKGQFQMTGDSSLTSEPNATISFDKSDLQLNSRSRMVMTGSQLRMDSGNLTLDEYASLNSTSSMQMHLLKTSVNLRNQGSLGFSQQSLLNVSGQIAAADESSLYIDSSSLSIQRDRKCIQEQEVCSCNCSNTCSYDLICDDDEYQLNCADRCLWVVCSTWERELCGECEFTCETICLEEELSPAGISFAQQSSSRFIKSAVEISDGMVELGDTSSLDAEDSTSIHVGSGSWQMTHTSNTRLHSGSSFQVDSGQMILGGSSQVTSSGAKISVNSGELRVSEASKMDLQESQMELHGTSQFSESGSLQASRNSSIRVTGSFSVQNESAIHLQQSEFRLSNAGSMNLGHNSVLNLTDSAVGVIESGTLQVDDQVAIHIASGSQLISHDLINFRGAANVRIPSGGEMLIEQTGTVSFYHELDISSENDNDLLSAQKTSPGAWNNHGKVDFSQSTGGRVMVKTFNGELGRMYFGGANLTFTNLTNSGMVYFANSRVNTENPLTVNSDGSSQGSLVLEGTFVNEGNLLHDAEEGTHFTVQGDYHSADSTSLFLTVLEPTTPGTGYSFVDVSGKARLKGKVSICLDSLALGNSRVKEIELFKYGSRHGDFSEVVFECTEEHFQSKSAMKRPVWERKLRELQQTQSDLSCTSTSTGSRSFVLLLDNCGGDSSENWVISWLSLGFIVLALILIMIVVSLYQLRPFRNQVLGSEASRISSVRKSRKKWSKKQSQPSSGWTEFETLEETDKSADSESSSADILEDGLGI